MVHKHKTFPVGKTGQRKVKKQFLDQVKDGVGATAKKTLTPADNAEVAVKAAHMEFMSILGNRANSQITKKGGRKTRIDPLTLKKLTDKLLRDIADGELVNENISESEDASSDSEASR